MPLATDDDAMREFAQNSGADRPEQPWLLTSYDVWMPNPHFRGTRPPHPEFFDPSSEGEPDPTPF